MKKLLLLSFFILSFIPDVWADDIEVTSELSFTATRVEEEPDPNNNEYVFSLFGNADGVDYKVQIDYKSENMYGTFTDDVFKLDGSGKYFNYIRTADGSKVWYFKHLDVTVSEVNGGKHIDINGLIQVYGEWRRVLVTGDIAAPDPSETIDVDLGTVAVVPNTFMGYVLLEAGNAEYTLSFGLSGYKELKAGTYYRTELLHPDFTRLPSEVIESSTAQLEVSNREDGELDLCLDLLSTDNILYKIHMCTAEPQVVAEAYIDCATASLSDYTAMYNIYQFLGENDDYQVAFSVRPYIINNSILDIPEEAVDLSLTQILQKADNKLIRVHKASGHIVVNEENVDEKVVYADLLAIDGTLYHVTFPFGNTTDDDDAIVIDCGDYVGRIDYTKEPGWMGLVLGNNDADVHVTVKNELKMEGTFTSDMFDYTGSYVTIYENNDETIRFADIQSAELRMDKVEEMVKMELTVMTINNQKYIFRAQLKPMKALNGETVQYSIDDALMVAFRTENEGEKASYHLQFQRYDDLDEDGAVIGNAEIWDFQFSKDDRTGIAGEYGYAAGTLEDKPHYLFENNSEIYLGMMAGTLKIEAGDELTVELFDEEYHTHLYTISAQMAAKNGIIYELNGKNFLLCVDDETGEPVEFTEGSESAIRDILTDRGLNVKKVLRNGLIILETPNGDYTTGGARMK